MYFQDTSLQNKKRDGFAADGTFKGKRVSLSNRRASVRWQSNFRSTDWEAIFLIHFSCRDWPSLPLPPSQHNTAMFRFFLTNTNTRLGTPRLKTEQVSHLLLESQGVFVGPNLMGPILPLGGMYLEIC